MDLAKKIIFFLMIIFLIILLLFVGFYFGNKQPTVISSTPTQPVDSLKTYQTNGINLKFQYISTWQILTNKYDKEENGLTINSIAINLERPHIVGNFGFNADIMIVDYLPFPEKESLKIDDFISLIENGEGSRSTSYTKNGFLIVRSIKESDLYGKITSYYFEYKDAQEKKHFVRINTLNQDNENILKAINSIIESLSN